MKTKKEKEKYWSIRIVMQSKPSSLKSFEEILVGYGKVEFYRADVAKSKKKAIEVIR